jgi:hypothetical protein
VQSLSELLYDWRFTPSQFILEQAPWDSRPGFFFQLNTCSHSYYVTSSRTRGLVCRLQLLQALVSAVILGSESRGTHYHILLSQIRNSPTWRARPPYLYPPLTGGPSYTPRHWVPFSSAPTTHRDTVEVFDPASTRVQSRVIMNGVLDNWILYTDRLQKHRFQESPTCLFILRVPAKTLYTLLLFTIRATCHAHLFQLNLII